MTIKQVPVFRNGKEGEPQVVHDRTDLRTIMRTEFGHSLSIYPTIENPDAIPDTISTIVTDHITGKDTGGEFCREAINDEEFRKTPTLRELIVKRIKFFKIVYIAAKE